MMSMRDHRTTAMPGFQRAAMIGIFGLAVLSCSLAEAATLDVRQLNAIRKNVARFSDVTLRVEGRLLSAGGNVCRLVHCEIPFRCPEDDVRRLGNTVNVEAEGKIEGTGNRISFVASSIRAVPNDASVFRDRQTKIDRENPDEWVKLGDWARDRGEFYEDGELLELARSAYRSAIQLERRGLKEDDIPGHRRLVSRAAEFGMPESILAELEHLADRLEWDRLRANADTTTQELDAFLKQLKERLPGAEKPLTEELRESLAGVAKQSIAEFQQADLERRLALQRFLVAEVQTERILRDGRSDGSTGQSLAKRFRQELPDFPERAEEQETKFLDYRMSHVETMTRPEIMELGETLKQRERGGEVPVLLRRWVVARAKRLTPDNIASSLEIADDYLRLLNDEPAAVRQLTAVAELPEGGESARQRLAELGYQRIGASWIKSRSSSPTEMPAAPLARSGTMPESPIAVGMTARALEDILGAPQSRTRVIGGRGVTEVWQFGRQNQSRLIIVLEQGRDSKELRVLRFGNAGR
ncbi:MAG: hypothetical protein KF777_01255 [Planctomycetaceae bacterium]|nr:hypothetical protein [Planctomycetaceae bacterium]